MAKLTSLAELASLLPDTTYGQTAERQDAPPTKLGYDGKPQVLNVCTERRAGTKLVTVITGFQSRPDELEAILQTLKKRCGSGGKVLDNALELQGDHRSTAANYLREQGFRVRQ
jgi:translation initiation factor 1